jgi:metalloprotein, YbeY/UPF0054 family
MSSISSLIYTKGEDIMIYIDDRQDKVKVSEEVIKNINSVIQYALKEEKVKVNTQISVLFVDDESIREINREQRGIDKTTDVLSFPMLEYEENKVYKDQYENYEFRIEDLDEGELVLGDIVLSLEKALEQSEEYGHSFMREVCYLTVHSILHLLGYDHMKDNEKR